jgi:hypothetical protein
MSIARRGFLAGIAGAAALLWPFRSRAAHADTLFEDAMEFRLEAARRVGYAEGFKAGRASEALTFVPAPNHGRPTQAMLGMRDTTKN